MIMMDKIIYHLLFHSPAILSNQVALRIFCQHHKYAAYVAYLVT